MGRKIESLAQARAAVPFRTQSVGFEDDTSYLVLPVETVLDDLIWFVDKADGKVHDEVAYEQFDRTDNMLRVVS